MTSLIRTPLVAHLALNFLFVSLGTPQTRSACVPGGLSGLREVVVELFFVTIIVSLCLCVTDSNALK